MIMSSLLATQYTLHVTIICPAYIEKASEQQPIVYLIRLAEVAEEEHSGINEAILLGRKTSTPLKAQRRLSLISGLWRQ